MAHRRTSLVLALVLAGFAAAAPLRAADWDSGDVDAAENYRELERERALRYRADREQRTSPQSAEQPAEPAPRPRSVQRNEEPVDGDGLSELFGPFDLDAIHDAWARLASWWAWLRDELVPLLERWFGEPEVKRRALRSPPSPERPSPQPRAEPTPPRADETWLPDSLRDEPRAVPDRPRNWEDEERRRFEELTGHEL